MLAFAWWEKLCSFSMILKHCKIFTSIRMQHSQNMKLRGDSVHPCFTTTSSRWKQKIHSTTLRGKLFLQLFSKTEFRKWSIWSKRLLSSNSVSFRRRVKKLRSTWHSIPKLSSPTSSWTSYAVKDNQPKNSIMLEKGWFLLRCSLLISSKNYSGTSSGGSLQIH